MKSHEEYRNSIERKAAAIIQKRKQRNRIATVTISAAVCLALIIGAFTLTPGSITEKTNPQSSFHGFVLTAYAAKEESQMLTADFVSDANSVVLQPHVEVLLGEYSPMMSSIPGLPFRFNTEDDCEMEVSVDKGVLCRWDITSGIVTQCGKKAPCAKGNILYWSPLPENGKAVKNANITVTAIHDGKTVGKQNIYISSNDSAVYSACTDEPELT